MSPTLDASKTVKAYEQAFNKLRVLTGFDHKKLLRAEAGSILKAWAGRVKVTTRMQIITRERLRVLRSLNYVNTETIGEVTINSGYKKTATRPFGTVWIKYAKGRKFARARGDNFSDFKRKFSKDWTATINNAASDAQRKINERVPLALRSASLNRQSVVQIADALGIDLSSVAGGGVSAAGIAKARAAIASSGRPYKNGTGVQDGDEIKFYVRLINTLPHARRAKLDTELAYVLQGRAKKIMLSYKKGVFDSAKQVQRQFPNLIKVS